MIEYKETDKSKLWILKYKRDAWTSPTYESIGNQTNLKTPGRYNTVVCRYYTNPWWGMDQKEKKDSIQKYQNSKPYHLQ
jgi:hypothetical protein